MLGIQAGISGAKSVFRGRIPTAAAGVALAQEKPLITVMVLKVGSYQQQP
jgi:hypothetical protein